VAGGGEGGGGDGGGKNGDGRMASGIVQPDCKPLSVQIDGE
jgi:hypothetical protein